MPYAEIVDVRDFVGPGGRETWTGVRVSQFGSRPVCFRSSSRSAVDAGDA